MDSLHVRLKDQFNYNVLVEINFYSVAFLLYSSQLLYYPWLPTFSGTIMGECLKIESK